MNDTVQTIAVCVMNMCTCACFTYLAMYFDRWWIVLFALLGYASIRTEHRRRSEKPTDGAEEDIDRVMWERKSE